MAMTPGRSSTRIPVRHVWPLACVALVISLWLSPQSALAQRDSTPSTVYFATFRDYYDGDFDDALRNFRAEGRGGIKTSAGYWIDSICYHTMSGECRYQMGQYAAALEHYDSALELYVSFYDWLIRVQFSDTLRPAARNRAAPWGQRQRPAGLADIPSRINTLQGNPGLVPAGGNIVLQQAPQFFGINVKEIIRCTALALRRKRELMGPTCAFDPLTTRVVEALAKRPCTPNHWSESLIDIQLGIAYAAIGKDEQARPLLERGTIMLGEYDHDLTGAALLEVGRIALSSGDFAKAATSFEEAGYVAFYYEDYQTLEDALRFGALTHLLANNPGVYPPLQGALEWASRNRMRHLQVTLLTLLAENYQALERPKDAADLLDAARPLMANRDMSRGRMAARINYLTAVNLYQLGKLPEGDAALNAALDFQKAGGSLWLFQVGIADKMYTGETVNARRAILLYDAVLRDPGTGDWLSDPLEAISKLSVPHPLVYEHWFNAAYEQRDFPGALEIADLLRRHRFLSTLPLGGRLLSLRWLLEAPDELLDQAARKQRLDLLAKYGKYAELAQQATKLRDGLERLPMVVDNPEQQRQQSELLLGLTAVSAAQEAILRQMAVRREPAPILFPPRLNAKQLQTDMPEGKAILAFLATSRQLYGFLITKDQDKGYEPWMMGAPAAVQRNLGNLLRALGNHEGNAPVTHETLASDAWKKPAADLLTGMFKGTKRRLPEQLDELIVVPDGLLWYLPFEVLQVPDGDDGTQSLIAKTKVRYVPTTSLALPDRRGRRQSGGTAVVAGQLYPGADPALALSRVDELATTLPGAAALPTLLPGPSAVYSTLFDRLIVFQDLATDANSPYDWPPLPGAKSDQINSLEQWMTLPWRGPDQVLLPGYHTPAERSLKGVSAATAGQDIFLTVCGLMASGARTVLLSRWRTGGGNSYELIREFAQELPHAAADDAWQRSVMLSMDSPIDPELEPRLKLKANDEPPSAESPFFWAGYLLVDTGAVPKATEDDAAEAPVVVKKKPRQKKAAPPPAGGALEDDKGKAAQADAPDADPAENDPAEDDQPDPVVPPAGKKPVRKAADKPIRQPPAANRETP
jgi:hypothetical protein